MSSTEPEGCEVVIVVDGAEIVCDRNMLGEKSAYFKAMFSSNMSEANASLIELKNVCQNSFKLIIALSLGENVELDVSKSLALLAASSMLIFEEVISVCVSYLSDNIDCSTCLDIMTTAEKCGQSVLYTRARTYSLWNFRAVVKTAQFYELTHQELYHYVSDKYLHTDNEEMSVFTAIMAWVNHNSSLRSHHTEYLISAVCLSCLSENEKSEMSEKIRSISHNSPCQNVLKNLEAANSDNRPGPMSLWVVGGEIHRDIDRESNSHIQVMDMHHPQNSHSLKHVASLPIPEFQNAWGYKACCHGQYLFVGGGETKQGVRTRWLSDVWRYDVLNESWERLAILPQPRRHHTMLAWRDHLYFIGGFGKHRILKASVERLSLVSRDWEDLPSLNYPVYSAAATVCQGRIYVIKQEVESWSPEDLVWTRITLSIPFESGILSAVTWSNKIYLTCAYSKAVYELDVEKRACIEISRLEQACGPACLIGQCLYVVSGQDAPVIERLRLTDRQLQTVTQLDSWYLHHNVATLPYYQLAA